MWECTFFLGVKSSWGINTAENKDLNQEDNQSPQGDAPQPTISHLETDLNNSIVVVSVGL
jgi:hypothetical protein